MKNRLLSATNRLVQIFDGPISTLISWTIVIVAAVYLIPIAVNIFTR